MNNNNTTYKDSPLGKIPSYWEVKTLGELGKTLIGLTYKPEEVAEENEGILVLRSSNVQDSTIVFKDNVFVNSIIPERAKVKEGDILICVRNGSRSLIGKSARIKSNCKGMAFGAFMSIYRSELNDYIFQLFQSGIFLKEINKNLGATINQITSGDLSSFKVPLPPLPEQKAIAHVLGLMDSSINNNNKLILKKELQKKWLMQNLLTGKKRVKGFVEVWKDERLGNLFKHIKNINDGDKSHSIMTISSKLGLISQEDKFDRVIAGESLKKYTQLKREDFAYNKGNSKTYPMGCIYQLEEKDSALVPFVYICFSPSDLIEPKFYKHWFLGFGLDRQLKKIITSGARGDGLLNVNTEDFFKLKIPYPQKEEQTAIARVLQAADKEIQLLKTKTERLREQKKGLMQVLLTGKKRLCI